MNDNVIGMSGYTHGDNAVRNPPRRTSTSTMPISPAARCALMRPDNDVSSSAAPPVGEAEMEHGAVSTCCATAVAVAVAVAAGSVVAIVVVVVVAGVVIAGVVVAGVVVAGVVVAGVVVAGVVVAGVVAGVVVAGGGESFGATRS